jgi:hypothetical protein
MEDSIKLIEALFEKVTDYGKTTLELAKLKTLDKTTDVVSSIIPHSVVFILVASFMLFFNLGIAFWLGEVLGKIFYGFLLVASFYFLLAVVFHFFMHKWIKKKIYNSIIKKVLK